MVYAIIESGGRQYKVAPGAVIEVNRLPAEVGETIEIDKVLMIGGDEGKPFVGQPTVAGAVVRARVAGHPRSRKIIVFKYKPKVRYRRMRSHRQDLTRLVIQEIVPAASSRSGADPLEQGGFTPGGSGSFPRRAGRVVGKRRDRPAPDRYSAGRGGSYRGFVQRQGGDNGTQEGCREHAKRSR